MSFCFMTGFNHLTQMQSVGDLLAQIPNANTKETLIVWGCLGPDRAAEVYCKLNQHGIPSILCNSALSFVFITILFALPVLILYIVLLHEQVNN